MRTLKHLAIFAVVALVAVFLAAPSAMAKKQLAEDELELITAAGQPKVVETDGSSSPILFSDAPVASLAFDTNAQMSLTALSLNNVVGENQLANGINIESTSGSFAGPQTVTITQTWGSVKDITAITIAGAGNTLCQSATAKCGVGIIKQTATPPKAVVLSMFADHIVDSTGVSSPITLTQIPEADLAFASGVQQTLAALLVNNVVGMNQVGNGVNIQSASTTLAPALATGSLVIGASGGANAASASQSVAITQNRGYVPGSRNPGF